MPQQQERKSIQVKSGKSGKIYTAYYDGDEPTDSDIDEFIAAQEAGTNKPIKAAPEPKTSRLGGGPVAEGISKFLGEAGETVSAIPGALGNFAYEAAKRSPNPLIGFPQLIAENAYSGLKNAYNAYQDPTLSAHPVMKGMEVAGKALAAPLDAIGLPVSSSAQNIVNKEYGKAAINIPMSVMGGLGLSKELGAEKVPVSTPPEIPQQNLLPAGNPYQRALPAPSSIQLPNPRFQASPYGPVQDVNAGTGPLEVTPPITSSAGKVISSPREAVLPGSIPRYTEGEIIPPDAPLQDITSTNSRIAGDILKKRAEKKAGTLQKIKDFAADERGSFDLDAFRRKKKPTEETSKGPSDEPWVPASLDELLAKAKEVKIDPKYYDLNDKDEVQALYDDVISHSPENLARIDEEMRNVKVDPYKAKRSNLERNRPWDPNTDQKLKELDDEFGVIDHPSGSPLSKIKGFLKDESGEFNPDAFKPNKGKDYSIKRSENFENDGGYELAFPDGRTYKIYRDTSNTNYNSWLVEGADNISGMSGFNKAEIIDKLRNLDENRPATDAYSGQSKGTIAELLGRAKKESGYLDIGEIGAGVKKGLTNLKDYTVKSTKEFGKSVAKEFADVTFKPDGSWSFGGHPTPVRATGRLMRAAKATYDLSIPLRQGFFMGDRPAFWKSFGPMIEGAWKKDNYETTREEIITNPGWNESKSAGVKYEDLGSIESRNEQHQSELAEKVPFLGEFAKMSSRGAVTFLNKIRLDSWNAMMEHASQPGFLRKASNTESKVFKKQLAEFINNATARGDLGKFESSATGLASAFFSPRMIASRLRMLGSPFRVVKEYAKDFTPESKRGPNFESMDPYIRRQYLRALGNNMGAAALFISLVRMYKKNNPGANVNAESDPTSSDFGKITIGNTRMEITGGTAAYLRVVAQSPAVFQSKKSPITGKVTKLNTGKYGAPSSLDALYDFAENKEATNLSSFSNYMRGFDKQTGEPFSLKKELTPTPLFLEDVNAVVKEDPKLAPWLIPAFFGMGIQVYSKHPFHQKRSPYSVPGPKLRVK